MRVLRVGKGTTSASLGVFGHPTLTEIHKCPRFSGHHIKTAIGIVAFTTMQNTRIIAADRISLILLLPTVGSLSAT
jgi:hypothetical protein